MNITELKQLYLDHKTQFVAFTNAGELLGSCDTLFKVDVTKNPLFEEVPFLESMCAVLFDMSEGEELTFPCIGEDIYGNDGYFDFSFMRCNYLGQEAVVWVIRDFTEHYEHLISLQQERNESEIKGEFLEMEKRNIQLENELLEYKNAELERLQQIKARFFSNISHELRTPLNGILGLSSLISETEDRGKRAEYTEALNATALHLNSLVDDILDHSKIEAGKVVFEREPFSLKDVLKRIGNSFLFACREKKIRFSVDMGYGVPNAVIGDQGKLSQILYNLVGNAVKFTERGYVKLNVEPLSMVGERLGLSFSVADTGIGIPADKLDSIFDPYEQAEDNTSRLFGGTGLGLNIVKQLVELQGGKIKVESRLGEGTMFTFDTYFGLSDSDEVGQSAQDEGQPMMPVYLNADILVGEDNAINQSVLKGLFSKWGCRVHVVENGKKVMEALGAGKYDLLLLDYQMPEMDGYEAVRLIRKSGDTAYRDIPILMFTGEEREGIQDKFRGLGIMGYIAKPIQPQMLLEKVTGILKSLPHEKKKSSFSLLSEDGYVNLGYLHKLMEGNKERIKELVDIFLETAPLHMKEMFERCESKDWDGLYKLIHRSKSNYKYLGISSCGEMLEKMEQDLKNGKNYSDYRTILNTVDDITKSCISYLSQIKWGNYGSPDTGTSHVGV